MIEERIDDFPFAEQLPLHYQHRKTMSRKKYMTKEIQTKDSFWALILLRHKT